MFSLQDFPVGSYLYWIRRVSFKETQVVFTRYQITEHDEDGNLLSDVESDHEVIWGGDTPEITRVRKSKAPSGFTIIHPKELYLNFNPHNMIIPEVLFNIYHHPERLPQTPLGELQKLLGSGLGDIDELIKAATISFEEWNKDKKLKTAVRLKPMLKNVKVGQEVVVVSPPPYGKK